MADGTNLDGIQAGDTGTTTEPELFKQIDYVGFKELGIYDGYLKQFLNDELDKTIRTVTFDEDTRVLSFYNEKVLKGTTPAFTLNNVTTTMVTGAVDGTTATIAAADETDAEGNYTVTLGTDTLTVPYTAQSSSVRTGLTAGNLFASIVYIAVDGGTVKAYTTTTVTPMETPVFSMVIPKTDLSQMMKKIKDGTTGNVVTVGADGQVIDSGIASSTLATKQDVAEAAAGHITKELATAEQIAGYVADPTTAGTNIIYLLKDDTAVGEDVYKEYTILNGEFVCIGSTTTNLAGFVKEDALDAVEAKADSNTTEIGKLDDRVGALENGFVPVTEEQIASLFVDDTETNTP